VSTGSDPGWYPDPHDTSQARYWDGHAWTDRTRAREDPPDGEERSPLTRPVLLIGAVAVIAVGVVVALLLTRDGGNGEEVIEAADSGSPTSDTIEEPATTTTEPVTTTTALATRPIQPVSASATSTAPAGQEADGTPVSYGAANVIDGAADTTWRTAGDGVGARLTLSLPSSTEVGRVGLIPGYAKTDPVDGTDRFAENRRVLAVRWIFDDGTTVDQTFEEQREVQFIEASATTSTVIVEIVSTTSHGGRDFTPISEIEVEGNPA